MKLSYKLAAAFFCIAAGIGVAAALPGLTAALAVGMMESTTLGAMTPINLVFMFSLAQLAGMSRESVSR